MTYRIAYTDDAGVQRRSLAAERRKLVENGMTALAQNPYGCGSSAVRGDRDRRDATIGNVAFITYLISTSVVTVTVVKLVPLP
ncbi:hypothetical protein ACFY1P_14335 [Streptomyces sp. NPDC001407]|uniref:hypothetical protein n=1 Tax=Streptomyces sp. NPDC001407 TaxID=3364573 RepID=UPI00368A0D93